MGGRADEGGAFSEGGEGKQANERWKKIPGSSSNRDNKWVRRKGIPGYLKKG